MAPRYPPSSISDFYDTKQAEYLGKYGASGRTHIHTAHFSKVETTEVFRDGWIRPSLGIDYLRSVVRRGQDRTSSQLISKLFEFGGEHDLFLDCGAGLGGTSWLVAERFQKRVDALTISESQINHIRETSHVLGLTDMVTPIHGDVFDTPWSAGVRYSGIFGIDSFCQMGNFPELASILNAYQSPGGVLGISDYFCRSRDSDISIYFNRYWRSDVAPLEEMVESLTRAGYVLKYVRDTTIEQLPYWDLSVAMSSLEIPNWSAVRRHESHAFHEAMASAFRSGEMRYFQIVAAKV